MKQQNIFGLLAPYKGYVALLVVFTLLNNATNLVVPKLVSSSIDAFARGSFNSRATLFIFLTISTGILVFSYLQHIIQTMAAERVAADLRVKLIKKISSQSFAYVQQVTPSVLLTNLTADIDAIKLFVSQAVSSIIASVVLIIGSSVLLLSINWRLALAVLAVVPFIAVVFRLVTSRVLKLFTKAQETIDWLNRVINESILGAPLVRVLHAHVDELEKFKKANTESTTIGLTILGYFAALLPIITFIANLTTVIILLLGGHYVITGSLSLGDLAAFNGYVSILIFPIIMIGFMSNVIARSSASYQRIYEVLTHEEESTHGSLTQPLTGTLETHDVSLTYENKPVLKAVSFTVLPHSKTAIIGPTAAGKTQLLYALSGLVKPTTGTIRYDGHIIDEYDAETFHRQMGIVFQDSVIFNMSIKENIAFNGDVTNEVLKKAIDTAELSGLIESLPDGLETMVAERGASLSGGQKQRIMLARALVLNPTILILDDFTARVDAETERKILANIAANYPELTLISVTQKIASAVNYDQIILLMEGDLIAKGTHQDLLTSSPDYVQLFRSQQSTNRYEQTT